MGDTEALHKLAVLLNVRNRLDERIAEVIARPALAGHIGEFIAANVFDIELIESASAKGCVGHFIEGPLAGRTVNIKCYGKRENLLDINPQAIPDYYLVLTGPRSFAMTSRGTTRPFVIDAAYLFEAAHVVKALRERGVRVGTAASLRMNDWECAEIYPRSCNRLLAIEPQQRALLSAFSFARA